MTTIAFHDPEERVILVRLPGGKQISAMADSVGGRELVAEFGKPAPYVAPSAPTAAELESECLDALATGGPVDRLKLLKAVALWQAQLHGITAAQARAAIAAIYKTL